MKKDADAALDIEVGKRQSSHMAPDARTAVWNATFATAFVALHAKTEHPYELGFYSEELTSLTASAVEIADLAVTALAMHDKRYR